MLVWRLSATLLTLTLQITGINTNSTSDSLLDLTSGISDTIPASLHPSLSSSFPPVSHPNLTSRSPLEPSFSVTPAKVTTSSWTYTKTTESSHQNGLAWMFNMLGLENSVSDSLSETPMDSEGFVSSSSLLTVWDKESSEWATNTPPTPPLRATPSAAKTHSTSTDHYFFSLLKNMMLGSAQTSIHTSTPMISDEVSPPSVPSDDDIIPSPDYSYYYYDDSSSDIPSARPTGGPESPMETSHGDITQSFPIPHPMETFHSASEDKFSSTPSDMEIFESHFLMPTDLFHEEGRFVFPSETGEYPSDIFTGWFFHPDPVIKSSTQEEGSVASSIMAGSSGLMESPTYSDETLLETTGKPVLTLNQTSQELNYNQTAIKESPRSANINLSTRVSPETPMTVFDDHFSSSVLSRPANYTLNSANADNSLNTTEETLMISDTFLHPSPSTISTASPDFISQFSLPSTIPLDLVDEKSSSTHSQTHTSSNTSQFPSLSHWRSMDGTDMLTNATKTIESMQGSIGQFIKQSTDFDMFSINSTDVPAMLHSAFAESIMDSQTSSSSFSVLTTEQTSLSSDQNFSELSQSLNKPTASYLELLASPSVVDEGLNKSNLVGSVSVDLTSSVLVDLFPESSLHGDSIISSALPKQTRSSLLLLPTDVLNTTTRSVELSNPTFISTLLVSREYSEQNNDSTVDFTGTLKLPSESAQISSEWARDTAVLFDSLISSTAQDYASSVGSSSFLEVISPSSSVFYSFTNESFNATSHESQIQSSEKTAGGLTQTIHVTPVLRPSDYFTGFESSSVVSDATPSTVGQIPGLSDHLTIMPTPASKVSPLFDQHTPTIVFPGQTLSSAFSGFLSENSTASWIVDTEQLTSQHYSLRTSPEKTSRSEELELFESSDVLWTTVKLITSVEQTSGHTESLFSDSIQASSNTDMLNTTNPTIVDTTQILHVTDTWLATSLDSSSKTKLDNTEVHASVFSVAPISTTEQPPEWSSVLYENNYTTFVSSDQKVVPTESVSISPTVEFSQNVSSSLSLILPTIFNPVHSSESTGTTLLSKSHIVTESVFQMLPSFELSKSLFASLSWSQNMFSGSTSVPLVLPSIVDSLPSSESVPVPTSSLTTESSITMMPSFDFTEKMSVTSQTTDYLQTVTEILPTVPSSINQPVSSIDSTSVYSKDYFSMLTSAKELSTVDKSSKISPSHVDYTSFSTLLPSGSVFESSTAVTNLTTDIQPSMDVTNSVSKVSVFSSKTWLLSSIHFVSSESLSSVEGISTASPLLPLNTSVSTARDVTSSLTVIWSSTKVTISPASVLMTGTESDFFSILTSQTTLSPYLLPSEVLPPSADSSSIEETSSLVTLIPHISTGASDVSAITQTMNSTLPLYTTHHASQSILPELSTQNITPSFWESVHTSNLIPTTSEVTPSLSQEVETTDFTASTVPSFSTSDMSHSVFVPSTRATGFTSAGPDTTGVSPSTLPGLETSVITEVLQSSTTKSDSEVISETISATASTSTLVFGSTIITPSVGPATSDVLPSELPGIASSVLTDVMSPSSVQSGSEVISRTLSNSVLWSSHVTPSLSYTMSIGTTIITPSVGPATTHILPSTLPGIVTSVFTDVLSPSSVQSGSEMISEPSIETSPLPVSATPTAVPAESSAVAVTSVASPTPSIPVTIPPTTEPSLNKSDAYKSAWVVTVIKVGRSENVTTKLFEDTVEERLAGAYRIAFIRAEQIQNGTYEPLRRRRRRYAEAGDIKLEMIDVERDNTDVDLVYYMEKGGNLVPGSTAVSTLGLLGQQELALQLGYVVATNAKVFDGQPTQPVSVPVEDPPQYWIIGAVLGSVAGAVILVWCTLCLYFRCCRAVPQKDLEEEGEPHLVGLKDKDFRGEDPEANYIHEMIAKARSNGSAHPLPITAHDTSVIDDPIYAQVRQSRERPQPLRAQRQLRAPPMPYDRNEQQQDHVMGLSEGDASLSIQGEETTQVRALKKRPRTRRKQTGERAGEPMDYNEEAPSEQSTRTSIRNIRLSGREKPKHTSQNGSIPHVKEDDADLQQKLQLERWKNKQRQRERRRLSSRDREKPPRRKPRQGEGTSGSLNTSTQPREEVSTLQGFVNGAYSESEPEADRHPQETLDQARQRMHRLLDDAFSLVTPVVQANQQNKISPHLEPSLTESGVEEKGSRPRPVGRPKPQPAQRKSSAQFELEELRKAVDPKLSAAPKPTPRRSTVEKKHTPLIIDPGKRVKEANKLSYNPYSTGDQAANLALPQEEVIRPTKASSSPFLGRFHTTTFKQQTPVTHTGKLGTSETDYPESGLTTEEPKPIVITTHKDAWGSYADSHTSEKYEFIPKDTSTLTAAYKTTASKTEASKYAALIRDLESDTIDRRMSPRSPREASNQGIELSSLGSGERRSRARRPDGSDELDVIKDSLAPGVSPEPLIRSIREELMRLSSGSAGKDVSSC